MGLKLHNEFVVDAPLESTWAALLDVPAVGRCLPGAILDPVADDASSYAGRMKVKLGPVVSEYRGSARLDEVEEASHTVAYGVTGKELRGQGSVSAIIRSHLERHGESTRVLVDTDLTVTGRPAQFGRGIMQDVAGAILAEFARGLSRMAGPGVDGSSRLRDASVPSEAEDVLDLAAGVREVLGKRMVALAGGLIVAAGLAAFALRRRRIRPAVPGPPAAIGEHMGGWVYVPETDGPLRVPEPTFAPPGARPGLPLARPG